MKKAKRLLVAVCCLALVACVSIGATLAWLTDTTAPVVNTFTVGNIDITLEETTKNFKMVPGNTIDKDPMVTVKAGSEACYLFVKIEESDNLKDFIAYTVAEYWTELEGVAGVYYRLMDEDVPHDITFSVLDDDKVIVKDTVTKGMMDAIMDGEAEEPTLTFTAYAIQMDNMEDVADAWAKLNAASSPAA